MRATSARGGGSGSSFGADAAFASLGSFVSYRFRARIAARTPRISASATGTGKAVPAAALIDFDGERREPALRAFIRPPRETSGRGSAARPRRAGRSRRRRGPGRTPAGRVLRARRRSRWWSVSRSDRSLPSAGGNASRGLARRMCAPRAGHASPSGSSAWYPKSACARPSTSASGASTSGAPLRQRPTILAASRSRAPSSAPARSRRNALNPSTSWRSCRTTR